jgi:hypothetical protein
MSVTLFPLIGQWTTYNYYKCDEPDAVNGMLRFEQLEPEMNLANGNWLWFADTLGRSTSSRWYRSSIAPSSFVLTASPIARCTVT